ncbi:MAG: Na+ dependent nucleoside transporter N-terminal domain-containing protein, partial [Burkholderiales bacterium]
MALIAQSAAGLAVLLGVAWLLSENRRAVPWRIVLAGL